MKKNSETGSALFVVMMAAALGLIVAITLHRLTSATGLLAKASQLEADLDRLEREINGTLADAKNCPEAFRNAASPPVKVTLNLGASPVATVDNLFSGFNSTGARPIARLNVSSTATGLVVTEMDLREPYKIQSNFTAALASWELSLRLRIVKKMDSTTFFPGSSDIIKKFRINATVNGANQIVACSPLGSRTALGPMSPLRSTIATTSANCSTDAEKDTLCAALTPAARAGLPANPTQYFAASQGDVLAYGMMLATANIGAAPAGPTGFGLYALSNPLYGHGGVSSWSLYDRLSSDGVCTVMCIHKDAPIRVTRGTIAANTGTPGAGGKDAFCKTQIGPKYYSATFNDLALAGWTSTASDPGTAVVAQYPVTIADFDGQVFFGANNVGSTRVLYYIPGASVTARRLVCVRRGQF